MGGGEVARYVGKYGSKGVSKVVIIGGVPPYLLKGADNPDGVDRSVFEGIQKAVAADRYAFFTEFFKNFFNTDVFLGTRISEQAVQASRTLLLPLRRPQVLPAYGRGMKDFRNGVARISLSSAFRRPFFFAHQSSDCDAGQVGTGEAITKVGSPVRFRIQPRFVLRECETWTVVDKNSRNARVFGARYWREG